MDCGAERKLLKTNLTKQLNIPLQARTIPITASAFLATRTHKTEPVHRIIFANYRVYLVSYMSKPNTPERYNAHIRESQKRAHCLQSTIHKLVQAQRMMCHSHRISQISFPRTIITWNRPSEEKHPAHGPTTPPLIFFRAPLPFISSYSFSRLEIEHPWKGTSCYSNSQTRWWYYDDLGLLCCFRAWMTCCN